MAVGPKRRPTLGSSEKHRPTCAPHAACVRSSQALEGRFYVLLPEWLNFKLFFGCIVKMTKLKSLNFFFKIGKLTK